MCWKYFLLIDSWAQSEGGQGFTPMTLHSKCWDDTYELQSYSIDIFKDLSL